MASTATYHDVAAAIGLRINALAATDPVELQQVYSQRPLTDEVFDSSIFPFSAVRDTLLNAEQRLVLSIANSDDPFWRAEIGSKTDPIFNGGEVPDADENGVTIVGAYGAVLDSADQTKVCSKMDVELLRMKDLAPNLWIMEQYNYAFVGDVVLHTRPSVVVQVCIYDFLAQQNAFDADEPILLPDALVPAYIAGGVAGLVRDDEFTNQAGLYAQYFNNVNEAILSNKTSVSDLATMPVPQGLQR